MARTHGHGNPDWTRDETILALDLYLSCKEKVPSRNDPRVESLSESLRRLPYHAALSRKESFRNPAGVAFKLQNIRKVATGKGLGNVSEMDRKIWPELGSRPEEVRRLAELIRNGVQVAQSLPNSEGDDDDSEFVEGRIVTQNHKRRERNPQVRRQLLKVRWSKGRLACDMCLEQSKSAEPSFEDAGFEAHHLVPVSMAMERKTRLSDIALLCASCHRLLHRAIAREKRWLNIQDGRRILRLRQEVA
ncbi:MAG: HNH endonuclease [Elusimicrobia bacterium]|nr:HNH endonuclease [Elusimicrobiota bacterium]